MERVYLDNLAATPVRPEVLAAMLPYFSERFGNPSSVYDLASSVKADVEEARKHVARLLNAEPREVVFTSGGVEANNAAVKGVALAQRGKGGHIIVSAIEHHSVLNTARFLERLDFDVSFLPVDSYGLVSPERLRSALTPETVLVSIGLGNVEIGTVQPIAELAAIVHEGKAVFHADGRAAVGNLPVDVKALGVDLLSVAGWSLGAPKGIGALYARANLRLVPLLHGGIQENGRRAGTENVPGIIALGKAAELAHDTVEADARRLSALRDRLVSGVMERIEAVTQTGHPKQRLPGHASFCFEGIEGEALVFMLTARGIYGGTGSACASKALKCSPVLSAIGVSTELAQGSLVFTMNAATREADIEYVIAELPGVVERLRSISPVWRKKKVA